MKATTELLKALDHVREHFPQVTTVIINDFGRWLYVSDDFESPDFEDKIDTSILEVAANSIQDTPFIYRIEYDPNDLGSIDAEYDYNRD